ncbi:class I SAM-dependent methyltransferase [Actinopolymorpha pittospori]
MSDYRQLRTTFDSAAANYQAARPNYPDELYADLLQITGVSPPDRLLEVGCGPGKATLPLARAGFPITAVELGPGLAEQARHNLAAFPQVEVITSSFEHWAVPKDVSFSLVYAATAWAWVDPEIKYAKAAEVLRPGGHLAVWNATHAFPADYDPFFPEIQQVYEELGETREDDEWPPPLPDTLPDHLEEFEASGHFVGAGVRRYVWGRRYSADQYIALLDTFSGHIAMGEAKRSHLYAEIRRRLAGRPDGQLTRHWASVLTIGRRI